MSVDLTASTTEAASADLTASISGVVDPAIVISSVVCASSRSSDCTTRPLPGYLPTPGRGWVQELYQHVVSADDQEAARLVGDPYRLQPETDSELHVGGLGSGHSHELLGRVLRRRLGELGLRRLPLGGCLAGDPSGYFLKDHSRRSPACDHGASSPLGPLALTDVDLRFLSRAAGI